MSQIRRSLFVLSAGLLMLAGATSTAGAQPAGAGARVVYEQDMAFRIMNNDGTGDAQIGGGLASGSAGVISPDGLQIAFVSNFSASTQQLQVANINGTGATALTTGTNFVQSPTWNSTGTKIGFTRYDAVTGQVQFFTIHPDGSHETMVTHSHQFATYSGMFSPTDNRVAYAREDSSAQYDLCVMKGDGTDRRCLATTKAFESPGDWSPSGSKIVYMRNGELYTIKADGTGATNVTTTKSIQESNPIWPSGGFILYNVFDGNDEEIARIKPNGSGQQQLTNNTKTDLLYDVT